MAIPKRKLILSGLTALFLATLVGCSNGDNSSDTNTSTDSIKVSGNLGEGYAFYRRHWYSSLFFTKAFASEFGKIEKALAIPIVDASADLDDAKEITINPDGSFSVSLEKSLEWEEDGETMTKKIDWVILFQKTDGSISFLSIPKDDATDTLINLPISQALTDINVGYVNNNKDEGESTLHLSNLTKNVNYSLSELNTIASVDDILKSVSNDYLNNYGKPNDETLHEVVHVVTSGDYSTIGTQFTKADQWEGYAFHFYGEKNSLLAQHFEDLCKTDGYLKLIPPAGATLQVGDTTYSADNPFTSEGGSIESLEGGEEECEGGITYFRKEADGSVMVNIITGDNSSSLITTKPIPPGFFQLQLNGNTIGKFALSYNLPISDDQHLKTPIPAIKLDLDENNKIKGIYVQWYIYNPSTQSYETTDLSKVNSITDNYSIHLDDFDGTDERNDQLEIRCDNISLDTTYVPLSKCEFYPQTGIYYNYDGNDQYNADDINVVYNLGNTEFRYTYRYNSN